jgi:hypothetical protein
MARPTGAVVSRVECSRATQRLATVGVAHSADPWLDLSVAAVGCPVRSRLAAGTTVEGY